MTTRHHYFTRAHKTKIMADIKADNGVIRESLGQVQGQIDLFQGNMEAILELL